MQRFHVKGKLAPRYIGPFEVTARRGEVAYQLEFPAELSDVHNVFHVSQLRKCLEVPDQPDVFKHIDHRTVDINQDLTYRDVPFRILDEDTRVTRRRAIKFLKVQWTNHTEEEATWEREDYLKREYPSLFTNPGISGTRFFLRGEGLSHPNFYYPVIRVTKFRASKNFAKL